MRFWCILATAASVLATPISDRTLVVVDGNSPAVDTDHVVPALEGRGHAVDVKAVRDGAQLFDLGERLYDNVLVVPGKTKGLGKGLSARAILDFLQDGGNFAVLTTPKSSPVSIREAALQLGIKIAPRGVELVDHFGCSPAEVDFRVPVVAAYEDVNVCGSAVAQVDGNILSFGVVGAPATSYSFNSLESVSGDEAAPFSYGDGYVAAAAQLRNNARFAWLGSADLLTSNVGTEILSWAFQERGVLRVESVEHHVQGEQHHVYKIEQDVEYCANVQQWEEGQWTPYTADDMQIEFRMLDPYYRVHLTPSGGKQCVAFKIPDQYGMFTFDLQYYRRGLSYLSDQNTVTIRHTANDEWPRSYKITNSWVYLSGVLTVIAGWLLFVGIYFS